MRTIRSWPLNAPPDRVGVDDDIERLTINDYDYTPLQDIDEDVLLVEWDIQVDPAALAAFAATCAAEPERVRVAPFRLYTVAPEPVCAHRVVTDDETGAERWLHEGEEYADYFAFGLTYLPRAIVRAFLDAPAPARGRSPFLLPQQGYSDCRFTDQTFSMWHRWHLGAPCVPVPVDWTVRVEHLHQ